VVGSFCCRTRDYRTKPLCVAQHGTRFVLAEPPQVLGCCVVHPLQPTP
jgi:hypothetical protein